MTTKPRIIVPHHFYQVSSKGVFGADIFNTDQMKDFFLKELSISLKKFSFQCFAWSIMNDHYHLVIKTSTDSISSFMQRLNSTFAKEYNKKNCRNGVVFAKRFSSIVIQNGKNLNDIIHHIHLNPVRCGDCTIDELERYQWSGHRALVNNISDNILSNREVLKQLGDFDSTAEYKNFIRSTSQDSQAVNLMKASNSGSLNFHNSNCFVIGDNVFTQNVIELDASRKARIARHVMENLTMEGMLQKVKMSVDLSSVDFFRQGRLNELSTARQLFAIIGHCDYQFSCIDIAKYLKITASAVSMMISRSSRITELNFLKEIISS